MKRRVLIVRAELTEVSWIDLKDGDVVFLTDRTEKNPVEASDQYTVRVKKHGAYLVNLNGIACRVGSLILAHRFWRLKRTNQPVITYNDTIKRERREEKG